MKTTEVPKKKSQAEKYEIGSMDRQKEKVPTLESIKLNHIYMRNEPRQRLEVLFVTSYPPRACGIATYSQDLINSIKNKFSQSTSIKICALEAGRENFDYPDEVIYTLKTSIAKEYAKLANKINQNTAIQAVLFQHEFGLYRKQEEAFHTLLHSIKKPILIVFHSVLPQPDEKLANHIKSMDSCSSSLIVMTRNSAEILQRDYGIVKSKVTVIPHGTHLILQNHPEDLKIKYDLTGKKVLSTFGLMNSGKSIETTLNALPSIIPSNPDVIFLIIGRTHPDVKNSEGEKYRKMLHEKVKKLGIKNHVRFINKYLKLPELLDYLELTDIYLFTSHDPNQAVSGTFAYAMGCACPIISTPIPHAMEMLTKDTGIIFDFDDSEQLAEKVKTLLMDDELRKKLSINALIKNIASVWQNSALAHVRLINEVTGRKKAMIYDIPPLKLDHIQRMTTDTGIVQFAIINQPDMESGYTLDDNARALIVACMEYRRSRNPEILDLIKKYLNFIRFCQQPAGNFLNYVNKEHEFTEQNQEVDLSDSTGRAVWALGYLLSLKSVIPENTRSMAKSILSKGMESFSRINSPRSMAFIINGFSIIAGANSSFEVLKLIRNFANRLVWLFKIASDKNWQWFEETMTYANSIMPEALLNAWLVTGETLYRNIAKSSMNFLLSKTFNANGMKVISNKSWMEKGKKAEHIGEQPIDVSYTIMTLNKFYEVFEDQGYLEYMKTAFDWFLGRNSQHLIMYNPVTAGCFDGLEHKRVNINQGAESTLCYLMARLMIEERLLKEKEKHNDII
jgi:glycosyltransferase involved in cell wall biosynthesis